MFKFNGISNQDMNVVVEEESKFIAKASYKYDKNEISGSNGNEYMENGLNDIEISLKLYVLDVNKLDEILSWLNGVGELEYNGRVTTARFYSEVLPQRTSSIRTMDITLIRSPLWHLKNDFQLVKDTESKTNLGNYPSNPIIKLEKTTSKKLTLQFNDVVFSYTFPDNEDYAILNTEDGNIYYDGLLRNQYLEIDFKYPEMKVGLNEISITSGAAKIYLKKKDCWL